MDIMKELNDLEEKEELAEVLRKEHLPLVMWGGGEIAVEVNSYLKQNNIKLADIFVDDEYYVENMMLEGKKLLSYSNLAMKYEKVNIVLGHSNYEKGVMLEQRAVVNKVFYLFSVNYGIYEKTPISYIMDNVDEFEQVYRIWEDELSKKNFLAFLKTRISGDNKYILDLCRKTSNFFRNEIFHIGRAEVFLEIGAYDGDTLKLFLQESAGKYKRIYALEPDDINRRKLERYIEQKQLHDVIVTEKGAWNKKAQLHFSTNNEQLSGVVKEGDTSKHFISIMAEPLDTMFSYLDEVTLLKINYLEGVKEAIEGASDILQRHEPKLAITVGFDCKNIRCIPILIKQINPNYKLYLRYNRGMISSLTLYGIV